MDFSQLRRANASDVRLLADHSSPAPPWASLSLARSFDACVLGAGGRAARATRAGPAASDTVIASPTAIRSVPTRAKPRPPESDSTSVIAASKPVKEKAAKPAPKPPAKKKPLAKVK
jgi:hypothetical protein